MQYIYMDLRKKIDLIKTKTVKLIDIADIHGSSSLVDKLKTTVVKKIPDDSRNNQLFCISALEVIEVISKIDQSVVVLNIGELYSIICYKVTDKKQNKVIVLAKVAFVSCTLLCGGAVAIMAFHADAAIPDVFDQLYMLFLGDKTMKPYLIEVPYSIGIFFGITVFFNHIFKYKISNDPTPIEVEMRVYEEDVNLCTIESQNNKDHL